MRLLDRSKCGAPARVAISVIPVLITRTLLNSVYATSQLLPYVNVLTLYLNILSYLNILAVCQYALVQRCIQDEKKALLRLKGLAKMRDVIDKLVDATETVAPPHAKTPQDPEAPVAVKPGKGIIRARSERFDALLAQKGVNPVAGRAVAELKRIFERADRDGSGDIDMLEFCKALRGFGIYDPPNAARLALSSMRHAANQDDAAPTVDFDEFVDLLLGYEKHRVADIFPGDELRNFRYLPASLQLDVACRVAFLPFAAVVLAVALSVLDARTAEYADNASYTRMPASPSPSYPWRSPSSKMMSRSSRNCPADEKMASSSPSAPRIAAAASGPSPSSSSFFGPRRAGRSRNWGRPAPASAARTAAAPGRSS